MHFVNMTGEVYSMEEFITEDGEKIFDFVIRCEKSCDTPDENERIVIRLFEYIVCFAEKDKAKYLKNHREVHRILNIRASCFKDHCGISWKGYIRLM